MAEEKRYVEYDIMTPSWESEKKPASEVQKAFREEEGYWGITDIEVIDIKDGYHVKYEADQFLGVIYGEAGPDVKDRLNETLTQESLSILEDCFDVDISDFEVKISDEMIEKMKKWIDEIIKKEDEE